MIINNAMKGIFFHQRNWSMSDISPIARQNQAKEAINKRQVMETRKLGDEVEANINELKDKNEKVITKIKKDYDVQISKEKSENETKLTKMRNSWKQRIEDENQRF